VGQASLSAVFSDCARKSGSQGWLPHVIIPQEKRLSTPIKTTQASFTGQRRRLATIAVAAVALVSAALGEWISHAELLRILEGKAYDLCFRLRSSVPQSLAPPRQPAPITMVWIDTPTANYLAKPRWLWPAEFGEVLRAVAAGGAKVIGLDYYFSYPVTKWEPEADSKFFQAYVETTQQGIPVVLAYEAEEQRRASETLVPVYYQATADGNVGYAELASDTDGFIRRLEWSASPAEGQDAPQSFGLRIATAYAGHNPAAGIPAAGSRADDERQLLIHYYGPRATTFPSVSMGAVLQAARRGEQTSLRKWFQNRIVLIGPDDLPDRHPTPFYLSSRGGDQMMEGTEIHAHAISTIVQGDFLRPAGPVGQWTLLLTVAVLAALAGMSIRWPQGLLVTAPLIAGVFGVVVVAQARGIILNAVAPESAILLATVASYGARLLTQDRHRAALEKSFADMVSPEVLESVIQAGTVPLDGESLEVTVMFSDLRGFTTYSEGRDPQGVVRELNEYFDEMVGCVLRHGGMVNKYIGDGMMVLFGAPVHHPDHARRAVLCAQEMVTRMDALNQRRQAAAMPPWRIGIGIHTGVVVLGFVGARDKKMEYTANGDTVNVASRIEGLNKEFSTQILLSVATRAHMGKEIATVWKGTRRLTGRVEEENIYTV
jgi:adenylate cyclase